MRTSLRTEAEACLVERTSVRGAAGFRETAAPTRARGWGRVASLVLLFAVGCGGTIEALDARDPTLPLETRAWIASAEDGLIVARAELDVARVRLHRTERWVDEREDALGTLAAFEPLAEARLAHARAELAEAEARAALAEAKRTLVYAESAVRHDRGDHDLEPLRAEVETLRERMHAAAREASAQRTAAEEAARGFWSAYAEHAASGADTTAFWTAGLD
ncbi:MAG: hypothetical protein R3B99_10555 [Polyangiales bacterium]